MTSEIYVVFVRLGFGHGEEHYPKEAHFYKVDAEKRVSELNKKEDAECGENCYYYKTVRLVSADYPLED